MGASDILQDGVGAFSLRVGRHEPRARVKGGVITPVLFQSRTTSLGLQTLLLLTLAPCGARAATSSDELSMRLMQLPRRPHASLTPTDVVHTACTALLHNNVPARGDGLRRLFEFCTFECRSALTARQGARTVDRFVQYATSPAFSELVNAAGFSIGEPTIIAGTETRGALATVVVRVDSWATDGAPAEASEAAGLSPGGTRFRWLLQRERRPPHEGCWFVKEVLSLDEWYIFNGDTGSTTTD